MNKITVEETLGAKDLPSDILPALLYRELLIGIYKRVPFLDGAEIDRSLIGSVGTEIQIPYWSSRFSTNTISETSLDTSGYSLIDPSVTNYTLTIGDQIYVAWRLTDILKEDQPKYNWVQLTLRDAGRAIAESIDQAVRDVLIAGAGNSKAATVAGTLDYDDVINLLGDMKADGFFPDDVSPFLYIHPSQESDLLKDSTFTTTTRYATGSLPELQKPPERLYAGCRVIVTDDMVQALALIVFPKGKAGPTFIHALKRPLTVKTEREEFYGRQIYIASERYGDAIVGANGIGLITNA